MKAKISIFSVLMAVIAMPAVAGWQYDGYYVNDGYYVDDGSRFVVGLHGGVSMAHAKMKNEIGSLNSFYYVNPDTGAVISEFVYDHNGEPAEYILAGQGNVGDLPLRDDFKKSVFTGGGSVGFTFPNHTQWRLEIDYDYISETNYNQTPLLQGDLALIGGNVSVINVSSTGAKSTISTDIISAMAYYDFFDGKTKPLNKFIPYVGVGVGYAISRTTLNIYDIYGDLSYDAELLNYATKNSSTDILEFDNPTSADKYPASNNLALVGAIGASYGIAEYTFIDVGARFMYVPKISWNIANTDGSKHREWFSAEKMLYTNLTIGVRFEF